MNLKDSSDLRRRYKRGRAIISQYFRAKKQRCAYALYWDRLLVVFSLCLSSLRRLYPRYRRRLKSPFILSLFLFSVVQLSLCFDACREYSVAGRSKSPSRHCIYSCVIACDTPCVDAHLLHGLRRIACFFPSFRGLSAEFLLFLAAWTRVLYRVLGFRAIQFSSPLSLAGKSVSPVRV